MKAQFVKTLGNGEPNPYFVIAQRALEEIGGAGRLSLEDLRERCGKPHMDILVPALKTLIESRDLLKITEGDKVFLELFTQDRGEEPRGVQLVLETLVHFGISPKHAQEVPVRFGSIINRLTVPEIEEALHWLVDHKVIERGRGHSAFKAGPRWAEFAGDMRPWSISLGADGEFLKRRSLSPTTQAD